MVHFLHQTELTCAIRPGTFFGPVAGRFTGRGCSRGPFARGGRGGVGRGRLLAGCFVLALITLVVLWTNHSPVRAIPLFQVI